MSESNKVMTVRQLIDVLQKLPLDAPICYVDFTGYDDVDAFINTDGAVEIGPQ